MNIKYSIKLIAKYPLTFNHLSPQIISEIYNKPNICLILVFQINNLEQSHILITANLHLLFNINRGNIYLYIIYIYIYK